MTEERWCVTAAHTTDDGLCESFRHVEPRCKNVRAAWNEKNHRSVQGSACPRGSLSVGRSRFVWESSYLSSMCVVAYFHHHQIRFIIPLSDLPHHSCCCWVLRSYLFSSLPPYDRMKFSCALFAAFLSSAGTYMGGMAYTASRPKEDSSNVSSCFLPTTEPRVWGSVFFSARNAFSYRLSLSLCISSFGTHSRVCACSFPP